MATEGHRYTGFRLASARPCTLNDAIPCSFSKSDNMHFSMHWRCIQTSLSDVILKQFRTVIHIIAIVFQLCNTMHMQLEAGGRVRKHPW